MDLEELQQMDLPGKDLVGAAKEVVDCRNAYNGVEATNEILTKKLIVLDRAGKSLT